MRGIILFGLAGLLTGIAPSTWADFDHDEIRQLREAGDILPLEDIIARFRTGQESGRILETKLDNKHGRYIYEIELLDTDGNVRELYYDAHSGELLIYELYLPNAQGVMEEIEYDARTHQPLPPAARMHGRDDGDDDDD